MTAVSASVRPGRLKEFWRYFSENHGAVAGLVLFVALVIVAVAAPVFAPFNPDQQFRDALLMPPLTRGSEGLFLLGTDALGRDILSRLIFGARFSLFIGVVVVAVVVIGGIVIGAFTATEGAAVAALYSFILSLIYRLATWREYFELLCSSAAMTCAILFLIATSGIMSYVMTIAAIPDVIAEAILSFDNPLAILLIMNICLLIIGFFMDLTPAVLIFTPIFLPIAREIGMDPVHLGIMMIFNLGVGSMTPPVGSVLFVGCAVAGLRIDQVARPLLPFLLALFVALMLVTYIPVLSLGLPPLFGLM